MLSIRSMKGKKLQTMIRVFKNLIYRNILAGLVRVLNFT